MAGEIMLRKPRPELKVMLRQLAAEEGVSIERLMERVLWEWSEPRFRQSGFAVRDGKVVPLVDVLNEPGAPRLVPRSTLRKQLEGSLEVENARESS